MFSFENDACTYTRCPTLKLAGCPTTHQKTNVLTLHASARVRPVRLSLSRRHAATRAWRSPGWRERRIGVGRAAAGVRCRGACRGAVHAELASERVLYPCEDGHGYVCIGFSAYMCVQIQTFAVMYPCDDGHGYVCIGVSCRYKHKYKHTCAHKYRHLRSCIHVMTVTVMYA